MTKRRVHYVLSSHWDREWFQTFQDYRYRLVQLLDRVLDGLKSGALNGPFTTDGQIVVLEDYLAIRPERRAEVEEGLRTGKIVSGPWYNLPDEFLVSGESVIRNIRLGRQLAREMGAVPSGAGWFCDLFGHNSQMPQILAGFGIESGFLWRGVNDMTAVQKWRAADGSEVLCYKFGATGYCTYAFRVRGAEAEAIPGLPATPGRVLAETEEQIAANFRTYLLEEAQRVQAGPILFFDGGDHQGWDQKVYRVFRQFQDGADAELAEQFEFVHSSLDAYLEELQQAAAHIPASLYGELRDPGQWPLQKDQQWVIPGVLSSRVWIKQQNAHCQSLLCQWAEPFSALAHYQLEREYPRSYLDLAWKWLMTNHPHDSICGCSIDQVHEDMKYRFSQSRQIAERQTIEACNAISAAVTGEVAGDELRVTIFNPLPVPLRETAELVLHTPSHWSSFNEFFGFEPKASFQIYDGAGTEIPYQRLAQSTGHGLFIDPVRMPQGYLTRDVTVSLPLDVPALGYTTLTVRDARGACTRYPLVPSLVRDERTLENEHLLVRAESNGTVTVTDKESGQTYERWFTFEDSADIGDGWYHGQAVNERVFVSSGASADIAIVHDGPHVATLEVGLNLRLPEEFLFDAMVRSSRMVDVPVRLRLSLRPGAKRVEADLKIHNSARDHRLRLLFPSGAVTGTYLSDTPFDVVERPIALRADNHTYRELEVEGKPQQFWSAVHDQERGVAVVCDGGLLECAVRNQPDRPLALTLFRSTRRTIFTGGEPEGQLEGPLHFRFALVPLSGAPDSIALGLLGQRIAGGLRTAQLENRHQRLALRQQGDARRLPGSGSLLQVDGPAVVTSAQMHGAALEVRLYNPSDQRAHIQLRCGVSGLTTAHWVNLESEPQGHTFAVEQGRVAVELGPRKIGTLSLNSGEIA